MKIVFIEPKPPNFHIFSKYPLPRLGSLILGTMMKRRGWEVEVFIEELRKIDFSVVASADLVAVSTITSTAPRAYAIADEARRLGRPVLMGGPHVTFLTDEAMEHADFVIRGEGEETLMAFIDVWEKGGDLAGIPNLSYRKNGAVVHNFSQPSWVDLDRIPFPDFSLLKFPWHRRGGRRIIPFETSRGCPFDCSFCAVTGMFGRAYRFRSTAAVLEELRRYNDRRNIIFFYDDNFAANRKRTKELLEGMVREKFKFRWTAQVRADVTRDIELVRLMKKARCHTVYIGFESTNPESLKAMKKRQTVEEIARAASILRGHGIHIHGMFVFGFDQDDWRTVTETVKFARKARLTSTQFMILTPLPGSEFYEKMKKENRIQFHDWGLYDAHHVVFRPARFSLVGLQWAQIFSHRKFYSLVEMAKRFIEGRWLDLAFARYARHLNRLWQKKNRTFLKVVELLKTGKGTKISIDYREEPVLDR